MANRHYNIEEEFEIEIKLKVKIKTCSNYFPLTSDQISENVSDFKEEIVNHLSSKICNEYYSDSVTKYVDFWSYSVEPK